MTVLFYRHDHPEELSTAAALPAGTMVRVWRPAEDGLPPPGSRRPQNLVWWGFARSGLFVRGGFTELSLWRHGRMVHRLIITPRWARFPFMAPGDLQVGDLWTRPDLRGQGLARAALMEAHRRLGGGGDRLWYLVDAENEASIRLIESFDYRLVGAGERKRALGLAVLGRYQLLTLA